MIKYNCVTVYDSQEIENFKQKYIELCNECININNQNLKRGGIYGFCIFCNKLVRFTYNLMPQFSKSILFTETLTCPHCKLNNRLRAILHVFKIFENKPINKKIYLYEYNTNFFKNFYKLYSANNEIIGSEFFGSDKNPGEIINGIRHEDAMNLSFSNDSLDYIISNDVYEHVPDINMVLKDAKRCLKPGGKLIIHIPFYLNQKETLVRAAIKNDEIVYYTDKEYHGGFDCLNGQGCLAFYSFGCDFFDILKAAGFSKSYALAILDKDFVNIDYNPIIIFVCEK